MSTLLTNLNNHKLGLLKQYVIFYMGSILAIDNRTTYSSDKQARQALSIMLGKLYYNTPSINTMYSSIGEYREYLEKNLMVKICPSNELDIRVTIKDI